MMTEEQFHARTQRLAAALPEDKRHLAEAVNAQLGDLFTVVEGAIHVTVEGETFRLPADLLISEDEA